MGSVLRAHFWCQGVAMPIISLIGLVGNIAMIIKYSNRKRKRLMDHLMLTICIFDMVTLLMIFDNFTLSYLMNSIGLEYPEISTFLSPYSLFLASMSIYGSIYGTLCLSLERYLLVTNMRLHEKLTVLTIVLPIVIFSIISNLHRLFMLSTKCLDMVEENDSGSGFKYEDTEDNISGEQSLFCEEGKRLILSATELRYDRHAAIASLLFSCFNIIVPFVLVTVLNILSYREIRRILVSWGSNSTNPGALLKKHDLDLCLRTVYAVFIFGVCHGTRIIPNGYEMWMMFTQENIHQWSEWVGVFIPITHMLIAVACSLNYFVYYGVYGKVFKSNTVENEEAGNTIQMLTHEEEINC
eukprot:GFUD01041165.1.p1 GENE.GFUD01041165.1~~GFUD01041165.1.p1  ORF type:complete len:354 (+),score=46.56 GFUD01041165.1:85-1146(+)